jgi:hypothetical protein
MKMDEMQKLMAKIAAENIAEEKKRPAPTREQVESNARFLKKWAKGKPIVRQASDSTFWAAGKWMTKMDYKMADALVAAGFATLTGKSTDARATLVMK